MSRVGWTATQNEPSALAIPLGPPPSSPRKGSGRWASVTRLEDTSSKQLINTPNFQEGIAPCGLHCGKLRESVVVAGGTWRDCCPRPIQQFNTVITVDWHHPNTVIAGTLEGESGKPGRGRTTLLPKATGAVISIDCRPGAVLFQACHPQFG